MRNFSRCSGPAHSDLAAQPPGQSLSVSNLRLRYALPGQRFLQVLQVLSLHIPASLVVAITGPSGSGKTSLLHALCGLVSPDAGTVQWEAVDITRLPESARDRWRRQTVGLVFQDFHLFPGLSALQNVLVPASFAYFRVPHWLRQRAHDLLARVGVANGPAPVAKLSRGEMQRVAVARALLFSPPIVLADEPTASLDAETGALVHALLLDMCRAARSTLIIVTHDAALARHADVCYRLLQGDLVQYAPGEDRLRVDALSC
jgi:putative ABC transport system ATP-binding protein